MRVETAGRIASLRGVFLLRETTYSTCKNHYFLILYLEMLAAFKLIPYIILQACFKSVPWGPESAAGSQVHLHQKSPWLLLA